MNNNTGRNLVFESLASMVFTQEIEQRTMSANQSIIIMPETRFSSIVTPNIVTVKQQYSGLHRSKIVSMFINKGFKPLACP
jgi:hypothetical protein